MLMIGDVINPIEIALGNLGTAPVRNWGDEGLAEPWHAELFGPVAFGCISRCRLWEGASGSARVLAELS